MHHECGLIGLYHVDQAATKTYYGLYALQHRGQEGCGIYTCDEQSFEGQKSFGMVRSVLEDKVEKLEARGARNALGHCLYVSKENHLTSNLQPMHFRHMRAEFALASNGSLLNQEQLCAELQQNGAIFQSTSICEILAYLLVQNKDKFLPALTSSLQRLVGSFCYVILRRDKLYAIRDPLGMMPLALGRLGEGWVIASENCAFDIIGAEFVRDVEPGEIIEISANGLSSTRFAERQKSAICLMEYIYFARPDSEIDGINVHLSRFRAGMQLARESFAPSDLIVGVPESATSTARGYAEECGVPFDQGLIKNKYSGRTFIESTQTRRDLAVSMKLSPIHPLVKGKRITLVDDSIVRGTTSWQIIAMMRRAGAREVHMRIASPKMISPCFYGVDTSSYDQLIGSTRSTEEICRCIGADSLAYISNEGLRRAIGRDSVCDACFSEHYPTPLFDYKNIIDAEKERRARCHTGNEKDLEKTL